MIVELRIYKRFDQDLIALKKLGADLGGLIKEDLYAFSRGRQVFFAIPEDAPVDLEDRHSFHFRVNVTDPESVKLLKSVKNSYRNSFCKALLRESFVYQALGVYLTETSYIDNRNKPGDGSSIKYTLCELKKKRTNRREQKTPPVPEPAPAVSQIKHLSPKNTKETRADVATGDIDIDEAFSRLLF